MQQAPKTFRIHIGIFGRRNAGKSSILNAITKQQVSIVSDFAGTTTDPVEKPMELLPLGPVLFIDTAGIDDVGTLGEMRIEKTKRVFDRTDIAIIVTPCNEWTSFEDELMATFAERKTPVLVVLSKTDILPIDASIGSTLNQRKIPVINHNIFDPATIGSLKAALIKAVPDDMVNRQSILSDLVGAGEVAVLVVPIDKEAPKGRLIMPQVQSIRELLDNDAIALITKERELRATFEMLNKKPKLVVTDSQAFLKVAADTPDNIPLTSFSILFARVQGDLNSMVRGAMAIDRLKPGDKVLVAEACSHHAIGDDIGTVKIPRWLTQYVGGKLDFEFTRGHDFPANVADFKLIIHCGACMWNRREMLSRIAIAQAAGVPLTNYGLTIAFSLGIFERALQLFPSALAVYHDNKKAGI